MSILTQTLGYPRIGEDRELKWALEGYWRGARSAAELKAVGAKIRKDNWELQRDAGIDLIPSNDFSLYDHVLDMSCLLGAVPERYDLGEGEDTDLQTYFAMARGRTSLLGDVPGHIPNRPQDIQNVIRRSMDEVIAMEMTKWFDTNYHYIVPEFSRGQTFSVASQKPFDEFQEALAIGITTKPVLIGPVSYLWLGKTKGGRFDRFELLSTLLPVYKEILQRLVEMGAEWVEMDEPVLVLDLEERHREVLRHAYTFLHDAVPTLKVMLGTYFGELRENLPVALSLPVAALHLDAVRGQDEVPGVAAILPEDKLLSVGIVNGRNVWKNDLSRSLALLERAKDTLGADRLIIAPSCSLVHCPVTLENEDALDTEVKDWLAFAKEKLYEVVNLRDCAEDPGSYAVLLAENHHLMNARSRSDRVRLSSVQEKVQSTCGNVPRRAQSINVRRGVQSENIHLPLFPTTTIGSFPQTNDIRKARTALRRGEMQPEQYREFLRGEIRHVIQLQEEIGLDVLVHGEPERNDMVQYFAEHLHGFASTENGWVQSIGTQCVRPPIIYGDVERSQTMTVEWALYAQSLTEKPVKGMLTGPLTMLHWSFVRDDQSREETCRQIALAIRDEVEDLENAGIRIIQIDEPTFREGLPLRRDMREAYLNWATACFRLATNHVRPSTQIHTHMCYSEFEDILHAIPDLDADVLSIESARSHMSLLDSFDVTRRFPDIGFGTWDIHSPRVPSVDEMVELLRRAKVVIPPDMLWINPDCGLKTRKYDEVIPALRNMVEAARILREDM